MLIAINFEGVLIERMKDPCSAYEPMRVRIGAKEGITDLKAADHILILTSQCSNLALRHDWRRNPLWNDGVVPFDLERWWKEKNRWENAYIRMCGFVAEEFPEMFDVVDNGNQGKIVADLYIDDRGCNVRSSNMWADIAAQYGSDNKELEEEY